MWRFEATYLLKLCLEVNSSPLPDLVAYQFPRLYYVYNTLPASYMFILKPNFTKWPIKRLQLLLHAHCQGISFYQSNGYSADGI